MNNNNEALLTDLGSKHEAKQRRELLELVEHAAKRVAKKHAKIPKRFQTKRWGKTVDRRLDALERKISQFCASECNRDDDGFYVLRRRRS